MKRLLFCILFASLEDAQKGRINLFNQIFDKLEGYRKDRDNHPDILAATMEIEQGNSIDDSIKLLLEYVSVAKIDISTSDLSLEDYDDIAVGFFFGVNNGEGDAVISSINGLLDLLDILCGRWIIANFDGDMAEAFYSGISKGFVSKGAEGLRMLAECLSRISGIYVYGREESAVNGYRLIRDGLLSANKNKDAQENINFYVLRNLDRRLALLSEYDKDNGRIGMGTELIVLAVVGVLAWTFCSICLKKCILWQIANM